MTLNRKRLECTFNLANIKTEKVNDESLCAQMTEGTEDYLKE